jgi:predicted peptidase
LNKSTNDIIKKYNNFNEVFDKAYIGIPKGYGGIKNTFVGYLDEFIKKYPHFKSDFKIPTVLYMHGSGDFVRGDTYRDWITNDMKFAFISPRSHILKNRPTYISPAPKKQYKKVHRLRQAEIKYALKRMKKLNWIDKKNLFLIGNSEGALAAGIYPGDEFKARVILAWSCEDGYYSDNTHIGSSKEEPILSIIGTEDEYFGVNSEFVNRKKHKINGHCIEALLEHENSKVVVLPKTKHNLTDNPYTKYEILNFLKFWSQEKYQISLP